jgi:hypothetical protein
MGRARRIPTRCVRAPGWPRSNELPGRVRVASLRRCPSRKDFVQKAVEMRYLRNVSERTTEWYGLAFRWLPNPSPTEDDLKQTIIRMREGRLTPRSVNSYITAINSYLHWTGSSLTMQKLKAEEKVLAVYSPENITTFVNWKPKRPCQRTPGNHADVD